MRWWRDPEWIVPLLWGVTLTMVLDWPHPWHAFWDWRYWVLEFGGGVIYFVSEAHTRRRTETRLGYRRFTYKVPEGAKSITVECFGGGGSRAAAPFGVQALVPEDDWFAS